MQFVRKQEGKLQKMPPANKVVQVSLTVPNGRQGCVAWLKNQAPDKVADLLESTESLYTTVASISTPELSRSHAREVEQLRESYEKEVALLKTTHDETVAGLRASVEAHRHASERLEFAMDSMRKSDDSDEILKRIHDQLQLGTLTKLTDHVYKWDHARPDGSVLRGTCILDVTISEEKLRAIAATETNAILVFGLRSRVPGKSKLQFETIDNVPVLWASRSADDALSASTLVELAFTTYANATAHSNGASAVQVAHLEVLETSMRTMEAALYKMREDLRRLLRGDSSSSSPSAEASDVDTGDLVNALREYHRRKKRHARTATDLQSLLPNTESITDTMLESALKTLKSENYRQAAAKRKHEDEQTAT